MVLEIVSKWCRSGGTVDTGDLKSSEGNPLVRVRIPPPAPESSPRRWVRTRSLRSQECLLAARS